MNFTYVGADLKTTIKSYTVNENHYHIEFLDGSVSDYVSYDPNESDRILEIMTEQAEERQSRMDAREADACKFLGVGATLITTSVGVTFLGDRNYIMAGITVPLILTGLAMTIDKCKTSKELKKYRMFLEMSKNMTKSELEQKWSNFIGEEKLYEPPFNINHIDEKSYSTIKSFYKKYNSKK